MKWNFSLRAFAFNSAGIARADEEIRNAEHLVLEDIVDLELADLLPARTGIPNQKEDEE